MVQFAEFYCSTHSCIYTHATPQEKHRKLLAAAHMSGITGHIHHSAAAVDSSSTCGSSAEAIISCTETAIPPTYTSSARNPFHHSPLIEGPLYSLSAAACGNWVAA